MTKCCKPQGKVSVDKVLAGMIAGKKKKDIAIEAGSTAKSDSAQINAVNRKINSDEYKEKSKDFIRKLRKEKERLIEAISQKGLGVTVQYKDAVSSLEKLTKLEELLSGGSTERVTVDTKEVSKFLDNA